MKNDLEFDMEMAREYDKGIRRALPTYDAMFRMVQSFLRAHVKDAANILVVGAGGGNEIVTFGKVIHHGLLRVLILLKRCLK